MPTTSSTIPTEPRPEALRFRTDDCDGLEVALEPELAIEPGHQRLWFRGRGGWRLAKLLCPALLQSPASTADWAQWVRIDHDRETDARIMYLINLLAELRDLAPGLVQLVMVLPAAETAATPASPPGAGGR